jgi:hypothetical protein
MSARLFATAVLATVVFAGNAPAWEPLRSGPRVGSENDRSGFRPLLVTGPTTGKSLCPV